MKIALHCDSNNEESDAPSTAYLAISRRQARALLQLMDAAAKTVAKLAKRRLVAAPFGVTFGVGGRIPDIHLVEIPINEPDLNAVGGALLSDDFVPATLGEVGYYRIECREIEIDAAGVRFKALAKFNEDSFQTESISRAVLEAIADGKRPNLPDAVLEEAVAGGV